MPLRWLNREIIKGRFHRLQGSRFRRVALENPTGATRFKFFGGNRRYRARCFVAEGCSDPDGFEHLLSRAAVGEISQDAMELYDLLGRLV